MAVVTTKKKDSKYAHLKSLYNEKEDQKIEAVKEDAPVEFKKEEVVIERKHVIQNIALIAGLGIISIILLDT
jgi:hypothetical protein